MPRARFGNPEPVASHLPLLTRIFDLSIGDVAELGTGYFSTLLFHWLATTFKRNVYSFESKEYWYKRAKKFENKYHHIVYCPKWSDAPIERYWGMAFVDHSPGKQRPNEVIRLANYADYIVIHDTQMQSDTEYQFSTAFPHFKYKYDYTKVLPWTSVVSNFKDLSNL